MQLWFGCGPPTDALCIIIISAVVAVHETFYNLAMRETVLKSKEYKGKPGLKERSMIVVTHYW